MLELKMQNILTNICKILIKFIKKLKPCPKKIDKKINDGIKYLELPTHPSIKIKYITKNNNNKYLLLKQDISLTEIERLKKLHISKKIFPEV